MFICVWFLKRHHVSVIYCFLYSIGGADRLCCFMNIVILSYILSLNSLAPPQVQKFHVLFWLLSWTEWLRNTVLFVLLFWFFILFYFPLKHTFWSYYIMSSHAIISGFPKRTQILPSIPFIIFILFYTVFTIHYLILFYSIKIILFHHYFIIFPAIISGFLSIPFIIFIL